MDTASKAPRRLLTTEESIPWTCNDLHRNYEMLTTTTVPTGTYISVADVAPERSARRNMQKLLTLAMPFPEVRHHGPGFQLRAPHGFPT